MAATPVNKVRHHRHVWRVLENGHRSGGSDDDPEVHGPFMVCRCGEVRLLNASEMKRYRLGSERRAA